MLHTRNSFDTVRSHLAKLVDELALAVEGTDLPGTTCQRVKMEGSCLGLTVTKSYPSMTRLLQTPFSAANSGKAVGPAHERLKNIAQNTAFLYFLIACRIVN